MHPMPSTFNRSPANTNSLSASAPSPAASPQDWLKQSGALGSLSGLTLHASGSDAAAGRRELYRVDLQVLLNLLFSRHPSKLSAGIYIGNSNSIRRPQSPSLS